MMYALIISICLNIVSSVFIFMLLKQYNAIKKKNTVLNGNVIEMRNDYDEYISNILSHIQDEKERQEATDDEAKRHIIDIINNNNADAVRMRDSK
jgi:hypothetical protein